MNYQLLLRSLLGLLFVSSLQAQQIVPLSGYEPLSAPDKDRPAAFPKMNCDTEIDGLLRLLSGDSLQIQIEADTFGYPAGSAYRCLNCESLNYGSLRATATGFTYLANDGVEQGLDTLSLAYCKADGDSCTFAERRIVLVQRPARSFSFPVRVLAPGARSTVSVPTDELPGGLSCRQFVNCENANYTGRGQEALFLFNQTVSNDFRYEAARMAGTDLVCLQLCNALGLCDTYTFPFRVERPNVNLPFFDDFSRESLRPDLQLWQDEDVLINRNFAQAPPSLGVATFDAVDSKGRPYVSIGSAYTPRDYLTSAGINMLGINNATLTFYVQPRGLGDRPERQDSLVLQFRHPSGVWQRVWSSEGLSSGESVCSERPFQGVRIPLDAVYSYNGFQFRFYNLSNQVGALDHWHLDYVKLDDLFTELNLNDIALNQLPSGVVEPYLAMPYRQFAAGGEALLRTNLEVGVWNHAAPNPFLPATASTYDIREENTNANLLSNISFSSLDAIPAAEPFIGQEDISSLGGNLFNNYSNALLNLANTGTESYRVTTEYNLNGNTSTFVENMVPGIGLWVAANNRASQTTVFDDYYAYDDGSAELAMQALPGQTVVQAFEAYVPERLNGISIRLPRTVASTSQLRIRLVVYIGELEGTQPDYFLEVNPIYPEDFYQDSLQGFTSYAFEEPIELPVGTFYVGWQQLGNCIDCVTVGLDRSHIIPNTRFFNNGGAWFPFDGCATGAIMLRPLVGNSPVLETAVEEVAAGEKTVLATLFPNPASQVAHIRLHPGFYPDQLHWTLHDLSGRLLAQAKGNTQINLQSFPAGVYFLQLRDQNSGFVQREKLVVR